MKALLGLILVVIGALIFYFVCGQPGDQIGAALASGGFVGIGVALIATELLD